MIWNNSIFIKILAEKICQYEELVALILEVLGSFGSAKNHILHYKGDFNWCNQSWNLYTIKFLSCSITLALKIKSLAKIEKFQKRIGENTNWYEGNRKI